MKKRIKKPIGIAGIREFPAFLQEAWASQQVAELAYIATYYFREEVSAAELLSFVIRLADPIPTGEERETNLPTLLRGEPEDRRLNLLVYTMLHRMELIKPLREELFIALSKEESQKLKVEPGTIEGLKKFLSVHFPGAEMMNEEAFKRAVIKPSTRFTALKS